MMCAPCQTLYQTRLHDVHTVPDPVSDTVTDVRTVPNPVSDMVTDECTVPDPVSDMVWFDQNNESGMTMAVVV